MGRRKVEQDALFHAFLLDTHVPEDHLLRSIGRFTDLAGPRRQLVLFRSAMMAGLDDESHEQGDIILAS
jgi:hypothetical protein